MRIGIDFDNTLAGYDHIFTAVAQQWNLIESNQCNSKREVRDYLFSKGERGHRQWMKLQGQVYGIYMSAAELLPGVEKFLACCKRQQHDLFIISHKTEQGHFDESNTHLHQAALQWMEQKGFFSDSRFSIPREQVFFFPTRDQKVEKILQLELDLFIDDLEEVLAHPNFPERTHAIHYYPGNHQPPTEHAWTTCSHWSEIIETLFPHPHQGKSIEELVEQMASQPLLQLNKLNGGRNSNTFHTQFHDGSSGLLKQYYHYGIDAEERLQRETTALNFLQQQHETATPQLIASLPENNLILTTFVDGKPPELDTTEVIAPLCDFVRRLKQYSHQRDADNLWQAQEACLSSQELIRQVQQRINRLQAVAPIAPTLNPFIDQKLQPTLDRLIETIPDFAVSRAQQTLSPSDFGLHNTIQRGDGTLAFIDFEYFGWDDPVKLTADTLLHPGFRLTTAQQHYFREQMSEIFSTDDPKFDTRLRTLTPLYVLRWCTILLNEFLPELWARRQFSGSKNGEKIRQQQYKKAVNLFDTHFQQNQTTP